ncbi:MAG TPA: ornithine carbamoyltransferase [Actinobacteria bacterium]|nr:ornithine carbamoyltransferase [Actinomycetota bacterium]
MTEKRDLLTLMDYKPEEIYRLLSLGIEGKRTRSENREPRALAGKNIALIFGKPSTRTRISFEVAVNQLGGDAIYLAERELQMGRGETIEDTGRVLARYVDAIVIRTFSQQNIVEVAKSTNVPVINALTDTFHPCQALADLMTILEKKGRLSGIRVAYIGDGNNVCNSLMIGSAKMGIDFVAACPPGYEPDEQIIKEATAKGSGQPKIEIVNDPGLAARDADVLYTDVWASMGQEDERDQRLADFSRFQVDAGLLRRAHPEALIMHCLPAHRGEEISAEVIDGPRSIVFDQAENRLHVQKALLRWLLK